MSFTDEELAYLKAELPNSESILFHCARKAFRMEDLIARLEATEDLILNHTISPLDKHDPRYKAWLKACGK